jgi:hypothetical protein
VEAGQGGLVKSLSKIVFPAPLGMVRSGFLVAKSGAGTEVGRERAVTFWLHTLWLASMSGASKRRPNSDRIQDEYKMNTQ